MEEISNIISHQNPKPIFIGLQEVTNDLLLYLQPFLESMGYRIITQNDLMMTAGGVMMRRQPLSYGVAIAVLISALDSTTSSSSTTTTSQCHVQIIKSGFHPFQNTIMDRGLLWVHGKILSTSSQQTNAAANNHDSSISNDVLFTTTHLESFIPKNQYPLPDTQNHNGVKARKNQVMEIQKFCHQYYQRNYNVKMIMVTGDLNWDDERKKGNGGIDQPLLDIMNQNQNSKKNDHSSNSDTTTSSSSTTTYGTTLIANDIMHWKDAWKVCRSTKQEDGYTYDSKLNPMLKGNLRRRFDRCLYYYPNDDGNHPNSSSNTIRESGRLKNTESMSSLKKQKKNKVEQETNFEAVTNVKLVGTSAIDGIEWIKEVSEWKYGKPTGKMTKQRRPVCPSDHFGLVVSFFADSSSSSHN